MNNLRNPIAIAISAILILTVAIPIFGQKLSKKSWYRFDDDIDIAASLIRFGEFEKALSFIDHMRDLYGENPQVISLYKKVYSDAKMYPELERLIRGQLDKTPDNGMLMVELANVKFLQDDLDAADSLWNHAIGIDPQNPSVYIYVAGYKLLYGDYDGAIETYFRGRRNIGDPSIFSLELAGIYESQRNYPGAVYEYISQLNHSPELSSQISTKVRELLDAADDPDAIISSLEKGINESRRKEELYEILGDLYIKMGKMDRALKAYRDAGRQRKDDGHSLFRFANRCFDFQAYTTVIEIVDEYLRGSVRKPRMEQALLLKGNAQTAVGLFDDALKTFESLSHTAADYRIRSEALYRAGKIYASEKENCPRAISLWEEMMRETRSSRIIKWGILETASCYFMMEKPFVAESLLTLLAVDQGSDSCSEKAIFFLGDLALFRGDYEKALQIYNDLIGKNPGSDYANNAIERLSVLNAVGIDENNNEILDLFVAAAKAEAMRRFLDAATMFSDPRFTTSPIAEQAAFYAGTVFADAGDDQKAIGAFNRYVESYPGGFYTDRVYLRMGDIYMKKVETYPQAKAAFNKILEIFPDGPVTEPARERLLELESKGLIG